MDDLAAIIPPGRYFLGDPGMAMRQGLFQDALEAAGDRRNARVDVLGLPVVLVAARPAEYPNDGLLNRSVYQCQSGRLGIVHEDLLIAGESLLWMGSMIRVTGLGAVSVIDGLLQVRDETHQNLVRIDTVWNRAMRDAQAAIKTKVLAKAA